MSLFNNLDVMQASGLFPAATAEMQLHREGNSFLECMHHDNQKPCQTLPFDEDGQPLTCPEGFLDTYKLTTGLVCTKYFLPASNVLNSSLTSYVSFFHLRELHLEIWGPIVAF